MYAIRSYYDEPENGQATKEDAPRPPVKSMQIDFIKAAKSKVWANPSDLETVV